MNRETRIGTDYGRSAKRFLALASALFLLPAFSQDIAVYRNRISGDQSFAAGDYPVAASFYAQYAKEAADADDKDSLRDAYERQIDALILGRMPEMAERVLNEYEMRYPGVNPLSLAMWKGDLQLLQKHPREAIRIFERIMPGLTTEDPRRLRALASLAHAHELNKNFSAAADTYQALMTAAGKSPLAKTAFERRILCLASTSTPRRALEELLNLPENTTEADQDILRLLTVFAMIRTEGFANIPAPWRDAIAHLPAEQNSVIYAVLSAIGDEAAKAGKSGLAQEAYRAAFSQAGNKIFAYETIQKLVDLLDRTKEPAKAAALALKSFELFKGPYATPEIKLKTARILRSAGKRNEAVDLYKNIAGDPSAGPSIRKTAVLECAYLQNSMNAPEAAGETLRGFLKSPQQKGELDFLTADLLFRRKEFVKAAEAFRQTAEQHPEFRLKALYQSTLAWFSAKNYAKTIAGADELEKADPHSEYAVRALYLKAMAQEAAGMPVQAQRSYENYAGQPKAEPNYAAQALFKAAKIAFSRKNPLEAERLFQLLISKYPKDPLAPPAAYWRIYSFQSRGDEILAERETWLLVDKYPNTRYAIDALFNLAAHYADSGSAPRANAVLDDLLKRVKSDPLKAKVLLEKALLAFKSGENAAALSLLDQLYSRYPNVPALPEVYYLNADILRKNGDYERALHFYTKALERHPDPALEVAAIGSIADTLFTRASVKNDHTLYSEALANYNQILAKSSIPESVRAMTYYKSGRCEELLGNDDNALERYKNAVYHLNPQAASATVLWGTKAAEAIAAMAEKRPLKPHVEAAVSALQKLADLDLMEPEFIDERILKLEKLKYKP